MKKLLVLLLILMLSFSMFACGSNDTPADDEQNPGGTEQEQPGDEEGEDEETPDKLNPDDLIMNVEDDVFSGEYDFGFETTEDFAMAGTVAKVDYSNLSAHGATMESMLLAGTEKVFGGGFEVFGEYEEDATEAIDKLAYAIGMENSDTEASYLEAGVYHDDVYDKYFQYTLYTSENAYEFSSSGVEVALKEMKEAYGVTVSQKTAEKAVKEVLKRVEEVQDYYSLYQIKEVKGKGYTETVKVSVDGFCYEDGSLGYYFAVERERCYE